MDAAQLVLLLTSRSHVAAKSASNTSDDAAATGDIFAKLLRQKQAEHDQVSQQKASDVKPTRRDASGAAASSPQPQSTVTDRQTKISQQLRQNTAAAEKSTQPLDVSAKTAANTITSAKAGSSESVKDGQDSVAPQADSDAAVLNTSSNMSTQATAEPSSSGSETPNDTLGNGEQKEQSEGDQTKDQPSAADPTAGNVASTEGLGAIMALVTVPIQAPAGKIGTESTTGAAINAGTPSQPAIPASTVGGAVDPADPQMLQATSAAAAPTAPSQPVVSSTVTLPIATPTTPAATQQTPALNPAVPPPNTPPAASTAPAKPTDVETNFANIVASKVDSQPAPADNLRISTTPSAPDKASQLPRPLVRIDETRTPQAITQPTASAAPTTSVPTTSETSTAVAPATSQDYAGDGLRTFSTFSSLLPGNGAVAAGKQPDAIAVLRQQLAAASIQDQVAVHLQRAVRESTDKISIQLSPAELGRIHVKMSIDDDKQVSASISVERPATLELLQRDAKALERALQEAGLKADSGSLSFSLQRGNQGDSSDTPGWGQNGGRQAGSAGRDKSAGAAEIISTSLGNEIDTANGLVDVAV
jgi:flagellar hook-length control protein FliK